jgi:hypothetical protein
MLSLTLASCGDIEIKFGEDTDSEATTRERSESDSWDDQEGGSDSGPASSGLSPQCKNHSRDAYEVATEIDALLNVQTSYEEYHALVQELLRAFGRMGDAPDLECYDLVMPLAKAHDEYVAADETWANCNADPGCDSAAAEQQAQRRWEKANRFVERARSAWSR